VQQLLTQMHTASLARWCPHGQQRIFDALLTACCIQSQLVSAVHSFNSIPTICEIIIRVVALKAAYACRLYSAGLLGLHQRCNSRHYMCSSAAVTTLDILLCCHFACHRIRCTAGVQETPTQMTMHVCLVCTAPHIAAPAKHCDESALRQAKPHAGV
jgi:hypothetical protein